MTSSLDSLDQIIAEVVAPSAQQIDRDGTFPSQAIEALGKAGLLGLLSSTDIGGQGEGLRAAAEVIEKLSGVCGSTAMVTMMHYSSVPTVEAHGSTELRRAVASGNHLLTLALSETGSRSHFWSPLSTSTRADGKISLDASKSWVTSAGKAATYVWSSKPLAAEGPMTLWAVPSNATGLSQPSAFDGMGLRGNGSTPVKATGVEVDEAAMLGEDGKGLDLALTLVLPTFQILNAAASVGIMESVTAEAANHLGTARFEDVDRSLGQGQAARLDFARMRVSTDKERAFLNDALTALETGRADAMLRVLESKASAAEAAIAVTDLAMKVCGGAAFRKELGIERHFRDARAARVMAPTTDALLDFIGRSLLGMPLLDEAVPLIGDTLVIGAVAYDPKVVTIWEGFRQWFRANGLETTYLLYADYEHQVQDLVDGHIDVAWNSPLAWIRSDRMAKAKGQQVQPLIMRDSDCNLTTAIAVRSNSGIDGIEGLRGKVVGVGAVDSPQATLLPLSHLKAAGLEPGRDFTVRRFDIGVGLHGDHVGGERDAARALVSGAVDAACMLDANNLAFSRDGTLPQGTTKVIAQTQKFDHCMMTAGPSADTATLTRFTELLLSMSYADANVRPLLDLEGLKAWLPGRTSGYGPLEKATDELGFYDDKGNVIAADYRP